MVLSTGFEKTTDAGLRVHLLRLMRWYAVLKAHAQLDAHVHGWSGSFHRCSMRLLGTDMANTVTEDST